MADVYEKPHEKLESDEGHELDLDPTAVPDPVGVYDRPESNASGSRLLLTLAVIVILAVLAFYAVQYLL